MSDKVKELAEDVRLEALNYNRDQWSPDRVFTAILADLTGHEEDAKIAGIRPHGLNSGMGWREVETLTGWLTRLLEMSTGEAEELCESLLYGEEEEGGT